MNKRASQEDLKLLWQLLKSVLRTKNNGPFILSMRLQSVLLHGCLRVFSYGQKESGSKFIIILKLQLLITHSDHSFLLHESLNIKQVPKESRIKQKPIHRPKLPSTEEFNSWWETTDGELHRQQQPTWCYCKAMWNLINTQLKRRLKLN